MIFGYEHYSLAYSNPSRCSGDQIRRHFGQVLLKSVGMRKREDVTAVFMAYFEPFTLRGLIQCSEMPYVSSYASRVPPIFTVE